MGATQSGELSSLSDRANELKAFKNDIPQEKARQRIEHQLTRYTGDLSQATPRVLSNFLFSMEAGGKTQFHRCPHAGAASAGKRIILTCKREECPDPRNCPHIPNATIPNTCKISSSPDSVRNTVSHLRAIYRRLGKTNRWVDGSTAEENPALSTEIEKHIEFKEKEAVDALVQPIQATPLFKEDVDNILIEMRAQAANSKTLRERTGWLQQAALVSILQASGRRPGDIIRLHLHLVLYLPEKSGLLFIMTIHKTAGSSGISRFAIKRQQSAARCTVADLENYLRALIAFRHNFNNTCLLFPNLATHHSKNKPYSWHAKNSTMRLDVTNKYIEWFAARLNIKSKVTLYGIRIANALETKELATKEALARTMEKGGWTTEVSAELYTKFFPATSNITAPSTLVTKWIAEPSENRVLALINK
ncbi:hypothetical protein BDR26DRAFT_954941 [Obelidium mucronatum]|nr:hypothetical protein BDR26DRAFT_954941 [Obelidium mucronatum]